MILTRPAKKPRQPRKAKAKKTKGSATLPTQTPKRTRKAAAPVQEPVAVGPLPPHKADLLTPGEITPARLASLPMESFRHGAIFGPAGSGKTYLTREALALNPRWGLLTATTGVAASILGPDVPTMHSALGISDTDSAVRSYDRGTLVKNCRQIKKNYDRLVIDEMSMLNSKMFDVIFEACQQADLGICVVGDFLQLAPVPEKHKVMGYPLPVSPIFDSKCWKNFDSNTLVLKTQYRHTNAAFLKGLNLLRAGKGYEAIEVLKSAGVRFEPGPGGRDEATDASRHRGRAAAPVQHDDYRCDSW